MIPMSLLLFPMLLANTLSPSQATPVRIRVGILVYEGVYDVEFVAPLEVFQHATGYTKNRLEVFTVAPHGGVLRTADGLRIEADFTFQTAPHIDWLVVPSGKNSERDLHDPELVDWIRQTARKAKLVQSNCDGAFLLAAAGLLEGKRAVTYPGSSDRLKAMYPHITVLRNLRFVDDRGVITSPGGAASFDPALYLLEKYFGRAVTQKVAEELVIRWNLSRIHYEVVRPETP